MGRRSKIKWLSVKAQRLLEHGTLQGRTLEAEQWELQVPRKGSIELARGSDVRLNSWDLMASFQKTFLNTFLL